VGPAGALVRSGDLCVRTKVDLNQADWPDMPEGLVTLTVSPTTGEGLDALTNWLSERLAADLSGGDFPALTRERHRLRLEETLASVQSARMASTLAPEMAGEDLRRAAGSLSRITGEIGVEDVLGEVFASFCIGK